MPKALEIFRDPDSQVEVRERGNIFMKRVSSFTLFMKQDLVMAEAPSEFLISSTMTKMSIFPSSPRSKKATCLGFLTSLIKLALSSVDYFNCLSSSTYTFFKREGFLKSLLVTIVRRSGQESLSTSPKCKMAGLATGEGSEIALRLAMSKGKSVKGSQILVTSLTELQIMCMRFDPYSPITRTMSTVPLASKSTNVTKRRGESNFMSFSRLKSELVCLTQNSSTYFPSLLMLNRTKSEWQSPLQSMLDAKCFSTRLYSDCLLVLMNSENSFTLLALMDNYQIFVLCFWTMYLFLSLKIRKLLEAPSALIKVGTAVMSLSPASTRMYSSQLQLTQWHQKILYTRVQNSLPLVPFLLQVMTISSLPSSLKSTSMTSSTFSITSLCFSREILSRANYAELIVIYRWHRSISIPVRTEANDY